MLFISNPMYKGVDKIKVMNAAPKNARIFHYHAFHLSVAYINDQIRDLVTDFL